MREDKHYFFCGIGGSGMLPLATLMYDLGHTVAGSDRALDQGRTTQKFQSLRDKGIRLFPQDGSGISRANQILVASAAVEEGVPDVVAAQKAGAERITRAGLLADLFNAAPEAIAVGGTSGKSTTTGMLGWILHRAGRAPTIFNGAVMKNFVSPDNPFASAVAGGPDLFVSEVDESDGSIALFKPRIAVLNNIAFDHKPLAELRALFHDFANGAEIAIINIDNDETAAIAREIPSDKVVTFGIGDARADLSADNLVPEPEGMLFEVTEKASGSVVPVTLRVPGGHNVENALAALAAARATGLSLESAVECLKQFMGIKRRLDVVGTSNGVTVIDDFAHNPDKITATLATLHEFTGRLLIMFQPHGFGPLRLMEQAFVDCFTRGLQSQDVLTMPEPVYFGGTVERTVSSADIIKQICVAGCEAYAFADRAACGDKLIELARKGDRIVIMGARDDTLSQFASELLDKISK